jgi:hexosaminidase
MKYIVILLLIAFVSNAQITKEQLNLPWPQNITLTSGTFTITNNSKSILKVIRMPDYLKGD